MKRILVFGAKGMLGQAVTRWFARRGYHPIALSRGEFDIAADPAEKLERYVAETDVVVNCAGVIKPRISSMSVEDVLKVNALFPRNLARICRRQERPCVHVTTDCAYSGKRGGYTETDLFDATDLYGLSKIGGDVGESMVLRTSIIGEEAGQARSLLEWARSQAGREVNGFVNHRWNGVTTVHLAEVIETIFERGLHREGVFHVFSPEPVTKAELLQIMSDVYDLRLTVRPVAAAEACDRTLASVHPLARELCTKPIAQQLREMRSFFAA